MYPLFSGQKGFSSKSPEYSISNTLDLILQYLIHFIIQFWSHTSCILLHGKAFYIYWRGHVSARIDKCFVPYYFDIIDFVLYRSHIVYYSNIIGFGGLTDLGFWTLHLQRSMTWNIITLTCITNNHLRIYVQKHGHASMLFQATKKWMEVRKYPVKYPVNKKVYIDIISKDDMRNTVCMISKWINIFEKNMNFRQSFVSK